MADSQKPKQVAPPAPVTTPSHKIKLKSSAIKEITDLRTSQPKVAGQIQEKIDELKQNLFPHDSSKLKGHDNAYRVDSGEYRIIYEVIADQVVVYVIKIGHRKEVYR